MPDDGLTGRRILVVEDEAVAAATLAADLRGHGAEVLGPAATLRQAMALTEGAAPIDAAILDINLRGEMVYPVADRLLERGVSLVFATGYDPIAIPQRYAAVPRCEKPVNIVALMQLLQRFCAAAR